MKYQVDVKLDFRSYPVIIEQGALSKINGIITPYISGNKAMIVTDRTVGSLYLETLKNSLKEMNIPLFEATPFEPGEKSKCFNTVSRICADFLNAGLDRNSTIFALGGGVVGDIAGFAASIFMRGIPFIQIPTTLLACCDSSVGGKTGINFHGIKNILGTFNQPEAVIMDPEVLRTLPKRELISGLVEAVKTGLICDGKIYDLIFANLNEIISLSQMKIICQIIEQCVIQKARVVESDEKESGRRRILNFGHTMGHGIESALKGRILHGEAVLIGMCAATWLSHFKGSLSKAEFTEILSNLRRIPIETNIQSISFHQIFAFIKKDKKISHENLRFILLDSMNRPSESEAITEKDLADAFAFVKTLF